MSNMDLTRPCKKCGSTERKASGDCKACAKAYSAANKDKARAASLARYAANPEKARAKSAAFAAANPGKAKAYRTANQDKIKAYQEENADKIRANKAAYRAANSDKVKAYNAAWNAANSERAKANKAAYYAASPEKAKASNAAWKKANPDACRIYHQNRRARKRENGGILSKGLPAKLFKLQKGKCACCGLPLGEDYHLDHIMPVTLGGPNTDDNMQLLRQRCNNQKRAKHPVDFMQSRGFLL